MLNTIKPMQHSIIEDTISIAQFIKNSLGITYIIWSVRGSKSQLSLPGKKILWKISKALSKLIDASAAIVPKVPRVYAPTVNNRLKP